MSNKERIDLLEEAGFEVRVEHYRVMYGELARYYRRNNLRVCQPETKGGATRVTLEKNGGSFVGIALCSDKDNYCYKEGVRIALERALENFGEFLDWVESVARDD